MSETSKVPGTEYLQATPEHVASLANKLLQFSQELDPTERVLLMECIKRGLPPTSGKTSGRAVDASLAVFAAWLNSVVDNPSRWYPS
jgi:hypothetical protein